MFKRRRRPDLYPRHRTGHYPGPKHEDLLDRLLQVGGELQVADFPSSLENPDSLVGGTTAWITPGCKDPFFPCISGGDFERRLRPGHEHKIETTLEVVCL